MQQSSLSPNRVKGGVAQAVTLVGAARATIARAHGDEDEDIVKVLDDPDIDSPKVLYRRLKADGLPICPVCGTTYVGEGHCEPPTRKRNRQARAGEGEATELPNATRAAPLFREALQELDKAAEYLGERGREEYLKDQRFVAYINSDGGFQPTLPGLDQRIFLGAEQHPPEPLTKLIATHTLADEPLEPLLDALHPDPAGIGRERLRQAVNELKHKAEQLAKLVRGGGIRPGPPTDGEASESHLIAWLVHHQRELGQSDGEIRESLARQGYGLALVRDGEAFLGHVST